jgi:hypothetical protein
MKETPSFHDGVEGSLLVSSCVYQETSGEIRSREVGQHLRGACAPPGVVLSSHEVYSFDGGAVDAARNRIPSVTSIHGGRDS